jgi:hypothetical protein
MLDAGDRKAQRLAPGVIEEIAERHSYKRTPFVLAESGALRYQLALQSIGCI